MTAVPRREADPRRTRRCRQIVARPAAGEAIVTLILIDPCQWKETNIGELEGVPKHGTFLRDDKRGADLFWDNVMKKLRADAIQIRSKVDSPAKKGVAPGVKVATKK